MSDKRTTSFRLSLTARKLLKQLANQLGVSMVAVLEIIIRERAKQEGVLEDKKGEMRLDCLQS